MSTGSQDARSSVLVIGQEHIGGLASSLSSGFRDLGWDARHVKWGPWRPVLLSRLAARASSMAEPFRYQLRRQVAAAARDRTFDLVVVVKGPFLDASTISAIRRSTGAPLVCWNPDSPFDGSMSNSGGGMAAAIPLYDAYVTWADEVAERLQARARHVEVIPFGFDPHMHFHEPSAGIAEDRLVFIGTATAERQAWLSRLATWEPAIFGNGWEPSPGLDIRAPVFGSEFRSVVGEARWNLNLLRQQNRTSHNMRTFEIPGCGGRQLAPMSADHERFQESTKAGLFADFDELTALLDSTPPASPLDTPERLENHSYRSRVAVLVDHLHRGSW
ncbi:MAG: CgeB family protein [Acidimicrobiales bacterium]